MIPESVGEIIPEWLGDMDRNQQIGFFRPIWGGFGANLQAATMEIGKWSIS